MTDKAKSNETSTGHHPFIINPKKWTGTPWDADPHEHDRIRANADEDPLARAQTNADLLATFHARLARQENVSDLFGETARNKGLAKTGGAPLFPGQKKKLGKASPPTPSAQEAALTAPEDPNPFTEALKAKRLPLDAALPVRWTLPFGFSVRHLDGAVYLPLLAHGLRETADFLGVAFGAVAFEALRDVLAVHGPAGRVFRHLKALVVPLRMAFAFAASEAQCPDGDVSLMIGRRALDAVALLACCDAAATEPSGRGAVVAQLFGGTKGATSCFALLATPIVSLRCRIVAAREFQRKEPRYTAAATQVAACLNLLEEKGGVPAKRAIAAAFPGGFS